ncbi:MAG TPA: hypothetical protein VMF67_13655 [Rhizomicrobium sp.]|nr:hypothetical protein [Rhizomicrobium sp.]
MSKYDALGNYLRKRNQDEIPMCFAEIEQIIGAKLPRSAYVHRPWWSNGAANSVLTKVWLDAGYRSIHVDMAGRRLVFERKRPPGGLEEEPEKFRPDDPADKRSGRHPMIGALKGTFTIEPGYDLTQPAMPEWADLIDEKYGPEKRR